MNSGGASASSPVRPQPTQSNSNVVEEDEAAVMQRRAEDLARRVEELEDIVVREAGRRPVVSPVPDRPIDEEVLEHNVTHSPPKPWCPHCTKAQGLRDPHKKVRKDVPDVEVAVGKVPTISFDLMYPYEKEKKPTLVRTDHESGRVWSYALTTKAVLSGDGWIQRRIAQDIDNVGHKDVKVMVESDQEHAMVALQKEVQRIRSAKSIPVNSPVGESERNGRIENTIRRVEDKFRTFKSHVETEAKITIEQDSPIHTWMVRWSGELISKYSPGKDGKTSYERIRGQPCRRPIVQFCESVLYLPLHAANTDENKAEPKMKDGIWLGVIERIEEHIIGTDEGIVKCRTIKRRPVDQQWNGAQILAVKGSIAQPVPRHNSDRIPTAVLDREGKPVRSKHRPEMSHKYKPQQPATRLANEPRALKIFKKDVEKHGATGGCQACTEAIMDRSTAERAIRSLVPHNVECRLRMTELMRQDDVDKLRVNRVEERKNRFSEEKAAAQSNKDGASNVKDDAVDLGIASAGQATASRDTGVIDGPEEVAVPDAVEDLIDIEQETNVALNLSQSSREEFCGFLNNIQVGFANAIEEDIDVAEVYSVPRVAKACEKLGLKVGWSLDLCTSDNDGKPWDFTQAEMRNRAARKVIEDKPLLLIGSPPCTNWSSLMNFNWDKMDPKTVEERKRVARVHLEFCAKLYRIQHEVGRYFLHEHPASATSWHEETIKSLCHENVVVTVVFDQCRYGLVSRGPQGIGLAMKPTRFMTNSACIAQGMNRRCHNRMTHTMNQHKHVILTDGKAKEAQKYPNELCRAICKGLVRQIVAGKQGQFFLAALETKGDAQMSKRESDKLRQECRLVEEDGSPWLESAFDDVSGAELDPKEVYEARMEEVQFIRDMKLYDKVPIEECWANTGKAPISTKWIDVNKGDYVAPKYRSRNVAREIAYKKQDGLFAATPPLEVMKLLLSTLASSNKGERLMVADVKRAYFHAKCKRLTYVKLPPEDIGPGEENTCGRLNYSMYGTRDAAANWAEEYSTVLIEMGFQQGRASPCVFYHPGYDLRAYVHGDDSVIIGQPAAPKWMRETMEKKYELTVETLGPDKDQVKEVRVFNRVLRWTSKGIEYEVDPRHVEIILQQLNIDQCKPVSTPGTKEEGELKSGDAILAPRLLLDEQRSYAYRALVARANYLAPDRPDIAFAVKELARAMSKPDEGDWCRLRRLARYLKGKPRLVKMFKWQEWPPTLSIFTDADWAGDKKTRKSTSGGCIMIGKHVVKAWSKSQSLIALSSGESELYATLKASAEGLGMQSIAKDLNLHMRGEVWGDASAALGIINRKGLGKTRHIDIGLLWVQQVAAERRLKYGKVLGRDNPADLFTKYLDWDTISRHCQKINAEFPEGRAASAPTLHSLLAAWQLENEDDRESRNDLAMSLSTITEPPEGYEEDELGLWQPKVYALLRDDEGDSWVGFLNCMSRCSWNVADGGEDECMKNGHLVRRHGGNAVGSTVRQDSHHEAPVSRLHKSSSRTCRASVVSIDEKVAEDEHVASIRCARQFPPATSHSASGPASLLSRPLHPDQRAVLLELPRSPSVACGSMFSLAHSCIGRRPVLHRHHSTHEVHREVVDKLLGQVSYYGSVWPRWGALSAKRTPAQLEAQREGQSSSPSPYRWRSVDPATSHALPQSISCYSLSCYPPCLRGCMAKSNASSFQSAEEQLHVRLGADSAKNEEGICVLRMACLCMASLTCSRNSELRRYLVASNRVCCGTLRGKHWPVQQWVNINVIDRPGGRHASADDVGACQGRIVKICDPVIPCHVVCLRCHQCMPCCVTAQPGGRHASTGNVCACQGRIVRICDPVIPCHVVWSVKCCQCMFYCVTVLLREVPVAGHPLSQCSEAPDLWLDATTLWQAGAAEGSSHVSKLHNLHRTRFYKILSYPFLTAKSVWATHASIVLGIVIEASVNQWAVSPTYHGRDELRLRTASTEGLEAVTGLAPVVFPHLQPRLLAPVQLQISHCTVAQGAKERCRKSAFLFYLGHAVDSGSSV